MNALKGGKGNDLPNDGWTYRHYGVVEFRPVPEPTTALHISSGLIALAGFRRKFRKSYSNLNHHT